MSIFQRIASEIGDLVDRKNEAYGSSFARAGDFLRLLYPDGVAPEQMTDALLLVRIFDKQMRIATNRDALGESPYRDIAGYGILGAADYEQLNQERECTSDSASLRDAPNTSQSPQPAFAQTSTVCSTSMRDGRSCFRSGPNPTYVPTADTTEKE